MANDQNDYTNAQKLPPHSHYHPMPSEEENAINFIHIFGILYQAYDCKDLRRNCRTGSDCLHVQYDLS